VRCVVPEPQHVALLDTVEDVDGSVVLCARLRESVTGAPNKTVAPRRIAFPWLTTTTRSFSPFALAVIVSNAFCIRRSTSLCDSPPGQG
jgi:hypothetical protein